MKKVEKLYLGQAREPQDGKRGALVFPDPSLNLCHVQIEVLYVTSHSMSSKPPPVKTVEKGRSYCAPGQIKLTLPLAVFQHPTMYKEFLFKTLSCFRGGWGKIQ